MSYIPYQIKFTQTEIHNIAQQAQSRIEASVAIYVKHFYMMIFNAAISGKFSVQINFKKVDVSSAQSLEVGKVVSASFMANDQKCLGDSYDKRLGLITEILEVETDRRYVVKVIGEKARAYSKKMLTAYENEMTFLHKVAKHEGNDAKAYDDKLRMIAYRVYGPEELEVGSEHERNEIISQTLSELERLLDINIVKQGGGLPPNRADNVYRVSWESPSVSSTNVILDEKGEAEDAERYDLTKFTSYPQHEEFLEKPKISKTEEMQERAKQYIMEIRNMSKKDATIDKYYVGMKEVSDTPI